MSTWLQWFLAGAAFMVYSLQTGGPAQAQGPPQEEAALRTRAEAFVAAFDQGDAKALAAFWTPDGEYMDHTGRHLKGRAAIEHAYQQFFSAHQRVTLSLTVTAIRVMTPDLAIEDGTTDVRPVDGGPPRRARCVMVHLKQEGQWRIASVRETVIDPTRTNALIVPGAVDDAVFSPASHDEHLRELEWLIGDWGDAGDTAVVAHVSFTWAAHQNFIISSLTTMQKDLPVGSASQWIGWDPVAHQIRSWSFELSGGFGEGIWSKDGRQWIIKTTSTLRDGKQITATTIMTQVDGETLTWQSTDLTVDGTSLSDMPKGRMKRLK